MLGEGGAVHVRTWDRPFGYWPKKYRAFRPLAKEEGPKEHELQNSWSSLIAH